MLNHAKTERCEDVILSIYNTALWITKCKYKTKNNDSRSSILLIISQLLQKSISELSCKALQKNLQVHYLAVWTREGVVNVC